ncbi:MAG: hypothetical protein AAFR27_08730 [Pseudomonadota bacterium]
MKVYQAIAQKVIAARNCVAAGNTEWFDRHSDGIAQLVRDYLPHGSGFDAGTTFDLEAHIEAPTMARLTFETSFHHMNDGGFYDGWTHHKVIVWPDWGGFNLRVTGRDRRGIKGYIGDLFYDALERAI